MHNLIELSSAALLLFQSWIMWKHYARTQDYQDMTKHHMREMRKILTELNDRDKQRK